MPKPVAPPLHHNTTTSPDQRIHLLLKTVTVYPEHMVHLIQYQILTKKHRSAALRHIIARHCGYAAPTDRDRPLRDPRSLKTLQQELRRYRVFSTRPARLQGTVQVNLVVTPEQMAYLLQKQANSGSTMSEVVRHIISADQNTYPAAT